MTMQQRPFQSKFHSIANGHRKRIRNHGFTLIELAIVLVIVGLVLGGLLLPLAQKVQSRRLNEAEAQLREIKESLFGYAIANGRLPCPASLASNGLEDRRNDDATKGSVDLQKEGCRNGIYAGFLPWVTLGVPETDAWGNRFGYRVTNEFTRAKDDATANDLINCVSPPPVALGTDPNTCTLDLTDAGALSVETRDGSTKTKRNLSTLVPAVIISYGKNGFGSTSGFNIAQPNPPAANIDETQNLNPVSLVFMSRTATDSQNGCSDTAAAQPYCEFDDMVTWIPTTVLFNRLLSAGRLP